MQNLRKNHDKMLMVPNSVLIRFAYVHLKCLPDSKWALTGTARGSCQLRAEDQDIEKGPAAADLTCCDSECHSAAPRT